MIETSARRFVGNKSALSPAQTLRALADAVPAGAEPDFYGAGALIEELEAQVAALLGKEAAVFAPSGRVAQLCALRVHADRRARTLIATHPRSHIVEDESDAISALYGLRVARVGSLVEPFTCADLAAVHEPLAAVVVELPLRRAGYRVPDWDELTAIAAQARAAGAALHLDGARLWETAPGYGRSAAEIAAIADTVYVSFYKGLGALAGAALASDAVTIAAARRWIARAGVTLARMYPYVLGAREGLRVELPRMSAYHAHAVALARALSTVDGVAVSPAPPVCNAFVVHLEGEHGALLAARDAVTERCGLVVFERLARTAHPGVCSFELVVGSNTLALGIDEVRQGLSQIVRDASALSPQTRH
ncbi:MAG TPA: beta-eliminating lyase-related protein [Candidatus Limnocylindria bacterium]|nr:beta-eliminating lyase-related protein [Candidatus Limnocylindria bacterium]